MLNKVAIIIGGILTFAAGLVVIAAVVGFPVMWLWNGVMPDLFAVPRIDFWQALMLNLLSGILFTSTGFTTTTKD